MDDVISRQAAIDAVYKCSDIFVGDMPVMVVKADAYEALAQLPPAQPEIIRCKDCKYAEYIDDVQALWCTECGQGRTVAPYDFCSYGERREVTT